MDIEMFQLYIFEMDDVLEDFIHSADLEEKLDYSVESLGVIEEYLSKNGCCSDTSKSRSARYLGEVFRKNYGGHWDLCTDGQKFLYNGLPVIKNISNVDFDFCPLAVIENFAVSRKPGLLSGAIRSCINP